MRVMTGDLLTLAQVGRFQVIVHGCNCQCTMGAGIAKAIRTRFPEAYDADLQTPKGDRSKLGSISYASIFIDDRQLTIVNAYTQFHWRGSVVLADYEAIRKSFQCVKERFTGQQIGYPKIGAGLAKGDWGIISAILDVELAGEDHTLVVLPESD